MRCACRVRRRAVGRQRWQVVQYLVRAADGAFATLYSGVAGTANAGGLCRSGLVGSEWKVLDGWLRGGK